MLLRDKNSFNRPKKSLGQNFLINPKVAERIAIDAGISKKDTILEIGPGTGKLTEKLLGTRCKVLAVEKDDKLFEALQNKFKNEISSGQLNLIHGDTLEFDPSTYNLEPSNWKVVANIPYNITGAILKKFLSSENKPESMTLMVQKEVAERILARDGKESLLSISVKAYGNPEILFKVGRGNFFPTPNVDSAIIKIDDVSGKIFKKNKIEEDKFWEIVKKAFAHKRKKLSGNLKSLGISKELSLLDLKDKRAEDLSMKDWIALAKS